MASPPMVLMADLSIGADENGARPARLRQSACARGAVRCAERAERAEELHRGITASQSRLERPLWYVHAQRRAWAAAWPVGTNMHPMDLVVQI